MTLLRSQALLAAACGVAAAGIMLAVLTPLVNLDDAVGPALSDPGLPVLALVHPAAARLALRPAAP